MNCGCAPKYLRQLSKLTQDRKKHIKHKIASFFQHLQKKAHGLTNFESVLEADKIFFNGKIYTMEEEGSTAEAIATSGDRILFVGSLFQANLLKTEKTQLINLKGKTLLPGFIDSHLHLESQAFKKFVNLSGFVFNSQQQVKNKLVQTVNKSTDVWVTFQLYDPMITPGDMPHTKWDLDLISKEKAIVILQANGHVAHVNSKAFELAGIDINGSITPDPPFGRFMRNQNKELTGEIQQTAINEIVKHVPSVTEQQYRQNGLQLIDFISSKGITTVHDCGVGAIHPQLEMNFITSQFGPKCKIRLSGMYVSTLWDYWMEHNIKPQYHDPEVRLNGIKCWSDGTTQGGSAFLTQQYLKPQWGHGHSNYTQQQLDQAVLKAHKNNFRVGIHANGDAGIDIALNSLQKARQLKINPGLRLRIEHSTVCRQDQLQRMYQLGVSPSFLIGHVYFYGVAFRDEILGIKRASQIDPVKSAYKNNLKPTLHSDYNCQPIQPMRYIHNAVTRVLKYGQNNQVLGPEQCITVYEAIKAVTTNAAWQCHMDDIVGSLVVGKCADFVILERDPFVIDPLEIINIEVSQTWKGGVLRFSKEKQ